MKRVHIIVSGRVQGVFFRHTTNKVAKQLGLKGFVRNLPDGSVEVIAEGEDNKLGELVMFCREGPPASNVKDIKVEYKEFKDEFTSFGIKY